MGQDHIRTYDFVIQDNSWCISEAGSIVEIYDVTDNYDGTMNLTYSISGSPPMTVIVGPDILDCAEGMTPSSIIGVAAAYQEISKKIDNMNFIIDQDSMILVEVFEKCFVEDEFYRESIIVNEITEPMISNGMLFHPRLRLDVMYFVFGALEGHESYTDSEISVLINLAALLFSHAYRSRGYPDDYVNVVSEMKKSRED